MHQKTFFAYVLYNSHDYIFINKYKGPGPVLGVSYAVDNNRHGSHPQRDYDLAEEANITLVCEIAENAPKIRNGVLREN